LEADRIIADLCRRHRVSPTFGRRLRPLIERAQSALPDVRARIMELVDRSFAQEAVRARSEEAQTDFAQELGVLRTVAVVLHGWEPPQWLVDWGDAQLGGTSAPL
jgi:hypothetical protein